MVSSRGVRFKFGSYSGFSVPVIPEMRLLRHYGHFSGFDVFASDFLNVGINCYAGDALMYF